MMMRLKVIIVGTSPVETLRMEEALQASGCLDSFRFVRLDQAMDRIPAWDDWDLLFARYNDRSGSTMLSLLAPVLRKSAPPVIFLVDPFDPMVVTRLMNLGAKRVLPLDALETLIEPSITSMFDGTQAGPRGNISTNTTVPPQNTVLLNGLFHSSPVGMSINRLRDGVCIDCNESLSRLLEWKRDELIGSTLLEFGLPEDADLVPAGSPDEPESFRFERKIYTRDRHARTVLIHVDRIRWNGEDCFLLTVLDITGQEQSREKVERLKNKLERMVQVRDSALEAANRELEDEMDRRRGLEDFSQQLSQTLWQTPDFVAICALDGRIDFLNKAGRLLMGLSEEAPVDHLNLFDLYAGDMRRQIQTEIYPQVIARGIWRGETEFSISGRVIPLSQVFVCRKDAEGQYLASIARDVTDFKRVEQELRHSRERYRTLAEAAHDFIFMVSKEGLMEYANSYACRAVGFDPEKVEGVPASQFFPKQFAANHLHMFYEVHEIDRPIYTEGPFGGDGEEMWLGTWLVPIHNERGSLVSILGISRDVTEQRKTDDALQQALQNERKLTEMRSSFFSMTSHQFRTPLSSILLSAELLRKYASQLDAQKRSEHLERIEESAKRLNSMLEDILVIGRVESGRYIIAPKDFNLVTFIEETVREMMVIDRGAHELVYNHQVDHLPVYLDPDVLHRVVDNLLSNAIKYSPQGTKIEVTVRLEENNVLLEVADQGIGIPERDLKYLFQPFQRGSNAADYPGSGIGLTIIQKSVELLNGTVSLKSKEGQGTTFLVRFPSRVISTADPILA